MGISEGKFTGAGKHHWSLEDPGIICQAEFSHELKMRIEMIHDDLVGGDWLPFFIFPRNIGNLIIPIDSYFSEGWPNHQPVILFVFGALNIFELQRAWPMPIHSHTIHHGIPNALKSVAFFGALSRMTCRSFSVCLPWLHVFCPHVFCCSQLPSFPDVRVLCGSGNRFSIKYYVHWMRIDVWLTPM